MKMPYVFLFSFILVISNNLFSQEKDNDSIRYVIKQEEGYILIKKHSVNFEVSQLVNKTIKFNYDQRIGGSNSLVTAGIWYSNNKSNGIRAELGDKIKDIGIGIGHIYNIYHDVYGTSYYVDHGVNYRFVDLKYQDFAFVSSYVDGRKEYFYKEVDLHDILHRYEYYVRVGIRQILSPKYYLDGSIGVEGRYIVHRSNNPQGVKRASSDYFHIGKKGIVGSIAVKFGYLF